MPKLLEETIDSDKSPRGFLVWCPGCDIYHELITHQKPNRPCWQFDGNLDKPTFSPSLLVTWSWKDEPRRCHSFIRAGKWEFLGDCTHKLKSQKVDMVPVPD